MYICIYQLKIKQKLVTWTFISEKCSNMTKMEYTGVIASLFKWIKYEEHLHSNNAKQILLTFQVNDSWRAQYELFWHEENLISHYKWPKWLSFAILIESLLQADEWSICMLILSMPISFSQWINDFLEIIGYMCLKPCFVTNNSFWCFKLIKN